MYESTNVSSSFLFYGFQTNIYMNLHMLVLSACSMVLKQTYMNLIMLVLLTYSMGFKQTFMNIHYICYFSLLGLW